jgi:4-hydroxy-3-methylbut-2-enyl diphosphate reductase
MVLTLTQPGGLDWRWGGTLPSAKAPAGAVREVVLAAPRGFCAGVVRAIGLVEEALARHGAPVYVRRAIVHNPHVVARLEALGAVVVQEVDQVPQGAVVVFSAHGVSRAVRAAAEARGLTTVDATCPLVQKVHDEVRRYLAEGYGVVLIGHPAHDEVVGTLGQAPGAIQLVQTAAQAAQVKVSDPGRVACVSQTTLTPGDVAPVVDALRARFPRLRLPEADDICYATHQRQTATRRLAEMVDVVLVLGDVTSSNSQRLREVAATGGRPAHLVGTIAELRPEWLVGATSVGLTAGASTPEWIVQEAAAYFQARGASLSVGAEPAKGPWESVA